MPTTKLDRIQDEALRASLTAAHNSLRSGDFIDVVRRAADALSVILSGKSAVRRTRAKNLASLCVRVPLN
jgi:hypothetical protein